MLSNTLKKSDEQLFKILWRIFYGTCPATTAVVVDGHWLMHQKLPVLFKVDQDVPPKFNDAMSWSCASQRVHCYIDVGYLDLWTTRKICGVCIWHMHHAMFFYSSRAHRHAHTHMHIHAHTYTAYVYNDLLTKCGRSYEARARVQRYQQYRTVLVSMREHPHLCARSHNNDDVCLQMTTYNVFQNKTFCR